MKDYIKALLIIGSLFSISRACSTGCLRCETSTSTCTICDFQNSYGPDGNGGCVFNQIIGCRNTDADNGCFVCDNGRYYDQNTKTCLLANTIPNCLRYSNVDTCTMCSPGHYLTNNTCLSVSGGVIINNCTTYSAQNVCIECNTGFIPSTSRTNCISVDLRSCGNYRNYFCNRCDLTKTLNLRNSFLFKFNDTQNISDARSIIAHILRGRINSSITSFCLATTVKHCKIFKAFNKCNTCEDGYFLTSNETCQAYIVNNIPGCIEFESETACLTCINGFYLNNSRCLKSTNVENCDLYSLAANSCRKCISTHYLSGGACLEHSDVANCSVYSETEDICAKCGAGLEIDETGLVCVALPENCAKYDVVDLISELVTCGECNDGYFVAGGLCQEGSVEFCEVYKTSEDACEFCQSEYVLDAESCVPIGQPIENCAAIEVDAPVRCETCDFESVRYFQDSLCEKYADIAFCVTFSDLDTCSECALGYELANNACVEIPKEENCIKKNLGDCVQCKPTHELREDVCVPVLEQVLANCAEVDQTTVGVDFKCLGCEPNHIPIPQLSTVCIDFSQRDLEVIENCHQYKFEEDELVCLICKPTHVLSGDGSACLETCPEGEVRYMGYIDFNQDNTIDSITYARCIRIDTFDDLPDGCAVASHKLKDMGNACLKCEEGYIPIEACTLDNTFFNVNDYNHINLGQAFPVVSCVPIEQNTTLVPSSTSPDPNCKHYYPIQNRFYCRQCEFGLTGVIEVDGLGHHYVNCSSQVEGCDVTVRYGTGSMNDKWLGNMYGFSLSYEYTCHKCTNPNEIPFIHLDDNNKLKSYQLNTEDDVPSSASTRDGEMTVCREPTAEGLAIDSEQFDGFVSNCALGLIVVDLPKSISATTVSARCLACKDGYKAKFDQFGFYITECTPMDFCEPNDTDGWLEGCKHCTAGAFKFLDENGKLDPNLCISGEVHENCMLIDSREDSCIICHKGFYLDDEGHCVEITIPYCERYAQEVSVTVDLVDDLINFSSIFFLEAAGSGCYLCVDGYQSVVMTAEDPICVEFPNLTEQVAAEGSQYINRCSMYYLNTDGQFRCRACIENFVINQDHTVCHSNAEVLGCKVVNNDGENCEECLESHLLDQGVCYELATEFCADYAIVEGAVDCTACQSGYVKEGEACIEGPIENCGYYDESLDCETCKDGFYLLLNHCLPIPERTQCRIAILESGTATFVCSRCVDGYLLNEDVQPALYSTCLEGPLTDNCAQYDESFECQRCQDSHYLSEGQCVERTNIQTGCRDYQIDGDECTRCQLHYILLNDECNEVLNSVEHCIKYFDEETCTQCNEGFYLEDNECKLVPEENLVDDCLYYSDIDSCNECGEGYILRSNVCRLQIASNCSAFILPNICASCIPHHAFNIKFVDGQFVLDCDPVSIDRCLELNAHSGVCRICDENYYPGANKQCVEIESAVPNCKYYRNRNTCEVCNVGFVRSINGDSCTESQEIAAIEPNCTDLRYTDKPTCTACRPGYYFNSNRCQSCSANRRRDGCLYCDPTDNSKCLVCLSGYYMNNSSVCVNTLAALEDIDQDDEDDQDEGVGIFGSLGVALVMLLALIQR